MKKTKPVNYMKGQLILMPKKDVAKVYYNLLKAENEKTNMRQILKLPKDYIIECYIRRRNRKLIWG